MILLQLQDPYPLLLLPLEFRFIAFAGRHSGCTACLLSRPLARLKGLKRAGLPTLCPMASLPTISQGRTTLAPANKALAPIYSIICCVGSAHYISTSDLIYASSAHVAAPALATNLDQLGQKLSKAFGRLLVSGVRGQKLMVRRRL